MRSVMIMRGDVSSILSSILAPMAMKMQRDAEVFRWVFIICVILLLALLIVFSRKSPAPDYLPDENRPVGMWGYFGYSILFLIPIIGWIINIVFALGGTRNVNLKNFARSKFCLLIIAIVIGLIVVLVMAAKS